MTEQNQSPVSSVSSYVAIFAVLMVLTAITIWVAFYDLGVLNIFAAITIATVKAYLVVLYFMHMKYSPRILWLTAAAGFIWLFLMIGLTLSDFASRGWLPRPEAW